MASNALSRASAGLRASVLRYRLEGAGRRAEASELGCALPDAMPERTLSINDFSLTCGWTGCCTRSGNRSMRFMKRVRSASNCSKENVLVVVTRYFGGIHLGPDRFKHINQAARNALELGGFLNDGTADSHKKSTARARKR